MKFTFLLGIIKSIRMVNSTIILYPYSTLNIETKPNLYIVARMTEEKKMRWYTSKEEHRKGVETKDSRSQSPQVAADNAQQMLHGK